MKASLDEIRRIADWLSKEGYTYALRSASIIRQSILNGGKVLVCGNGGSASQSTHFVGELLGKFAHPGKPLPALDLTSSNAVITSVANDFGYEHVFSRQVRALGTHEDVLVALSTSGRSRNVNIAVEEAHRKGMRIIYLCGKHGNDVEELCDVVIKVPSEKPSRIQEAHLTILHMICEELEHDRKEEDKGS